MNHPKEERTFMVVKPDGVKRGLVGEVIARLEDRGLKVIAIKMVQPDRKKVEGFLPSKDEWLKGMGGKTMETYEKYGYDVKKEMGSDDPLKIGKEIKEWLIDFWVSGPVVAILIEGVHAVDMVRKIIGNTIPAKADMGTIRGDFSVDSPILANLGKRAIFNVVHASGDADEAAHETKYWFEEDEIHAYDRSDHSVMF